MARNEQGNNNSGQWVRNVTSPLSLSVCVCAFFYLHSIPFYIFTTLSGVALIESIGNALAVLVLSFKINSLLGIVATVSVIADTK